MRTEKGYTEKLSCSKTTKTLITKYVYNMYVNEYPEREGEKVPQNSLLIFMLKKTLGKGDYDMLKEEL